MNNMDLESWTVEEVGISDTASASIGTSTLASIDTNYCCRSTAIEIPKISSCPQDIAYSILKNTNLSSCDHASDVDREITMEDFLEL